jgi:hypothetical protein
MVTAAVDHGYTPYSSTRRLFDLATEVIETTPSDSKAAKPSSETKRAPEPKKGPLALRQFTFDKASGRIEAGSRVVRIESTFAGMC